MAPPRGRTDPSVEERLYAAGHRFEFFQAVRLLRRLFPGRRAVGGDAVPAQEVVRFRAHATLDFPAAEVQQIQPPPTPGGQPQMIVNFMGLIGALGVLPRHYTHLALQEVRRRNTTLRDFLDIFNHRVVSLFYRAWEKHQLPAQYEGMVVRRAEGVADEETYDRTTLHLFELIGLSSALLRRHVELRSPALLFFVGLIAQQPRSAAALRGVLQEYFAVPVHVRQFRGQWLALALEDRTSIGRRGVNAVLGDSAIIGDRVWDQQARFRLRLGPLPYGQFCGFLPSGSAFRSLVLLTRLLVGQEHDFDVQLVLLAADVPDCRIGVGGERAPRLGWSAFLKVAPFEHDSEAVILRGRETMAGTFAG